MIQLGPCEITGAFGPMCSGKTFLINQWLKANNRFVRFDSTGETLDDPNLEHVWMNPAALWARLKENPNYFRIAYHPGPELVTDFEFVVRCLWRVQRFKTLVCDEFHEICSVNETPKFVQTMLRYARHNHLAVIGASQRIADVHKLFTSGCRQTIIFWTQEARDLIAVQDRWGKEAAEKVANLRPLIYDDTTQVTHQVPQCLVIVRGSKPRIYDFATECFAGREPADRETDAEALQREDSSGGEDGTGPEGSGLPELSSSDSEALPAEGSVPSAQS